MSFRIKFYLEFYMTYGFKNNKQKELLYNNTTKHHLDLKIVCGFYVILRKKCRNRVFVYVVPDLIQKG